MFYVIDLGSLWMMRAISKAPRKPRRVALPHGIVSLGPLAAFVAFHPGPEFVERLRTECWDCFADHLERHPHRALAALASDPRIPLGLKLADGAGVGHGRIKAWPDTRGNRQYRPRRWIDRGMGRMSAFRGRAENIYS